MHVSTEANPAPKKLIRTPLDSNSADVLCSDRKVHILEAPRGGQQSWVRSPPFGGKKSVTSREAARQGEERL